MNNMTPETQRLYDERLAEAYRQVDTITMDKLNRMLGCLEAVNDIAYAHGVHRHLVLQRMVTRLAREGRR